jgi:putative aldouronate transport system substrate-binding protein
MVNEYVYEALGRPDMTRPDTFLQALRDARDMFPEINGFPTIPLGVQAFGVNGNVSLDGQLMGFLDVPWSDGQGNRIDRQLNEEWQGWLRVIRQAVEEGLFDVDAMVDTSVQINERIASGRYFALMYAWTALQHAQDSLLAHSPQYALIPTNGPRNSAGDPPRHDGGNLNGWV